MVLAAGPAAAHTLVTPYDLPIPFRAYVYACTGTLVLTFAVLAFAPGGAALRAPSAGVRLGRVAPWVGQGMAAGLLLLAVAAGLWGTASPTANIAPALVWVGLMVGLTAVTVVFGDVFAVVNPWRVLVRLLRVGERPRLQYPAALGCWPAFGCYLALEWVELIAAPRPSLLAWALLGYAGLTVAGSAVFGRRTWFARAELFGLFFRIVGTVAPVVYWRAGGGWRARLRPALSGSADDAPGGAGLVLFVLLMLAATTYDGVWQTSFWAGLYWQNLMWLLQPLWGDDLARAQALLAPGYAVYLRGGLVAAPFCYLVVYLGAMLGVRVVVGRGFTTMGLARLFALSLVPIAVAYMLAHSWTSLLTTAPAVPFLLSDPFGAGWNLLGLARTSSEPEALDMGQVWHVEVGLILAGHMASVYLAHGVAVRTFVGRRAVWLGELPLLALMVGYTFLGLAVLSLPLALH